MVTHQFPAVSVWNGDDTDVVVLMEVREGALSMHIDVQIRVCVWVGESARIRVWCELGGRLGVEMCQRIEIVPVRAWWRLERW
jgi:hypothetical protein